MFTIINTDKIISESNNYGPRYFNEVRNLIEKIKNIEPKKRIPIFEEFARNLTMIPSLWIYWYTNQFRCVYAIETPKSYMHFKSLELDKYLYPRVSLFKFSYNTIGKHYYMDYDNEDISQWSIPPNQLSGIQVKEFNFLKQMLHLPHHGKEKLFGIFDKLYPDDTNYPFGNEYAIKKYEASLILLQQLKACEENAELWIKYLKETENSEFIINSCEYRLGKNPENQDFWKCYLQYLKECGNIEMLLKTYSRYCRLFLNDDNNLLEEWFAEITETTIQDMNESSFNYSIKPKDRSIPGYKYDENFSSFIDIVKQKFQYFCENADENGQTPIQMPSRLTPATPQLFSLPKDTIERIAKNAPPKLLQKLQMLCKYFWYKNDVIYCHRLMSSEALEQPIFLKQSLIFCSNDIKKLKNYHIEHCLSLSSTPSEYSLSTIIKNIHSCNLRYLKFSSQQLSMNEFKFIAATKKLKSVDMFDIVIQRIDNEMAKLGEIFEYFPNVEIFKFYTSISWFGTKKPDGIEYTSETASRLLSLKRNAKLAYFKINKLPNRLDPKDFALFIKKNASPDATFILSWKEKEAKEIAKPIIKNTVFGDKKFYEWQMKFLFGHGNHYDKK